MKKVLFSFMVFNVIFGLLYSNVFANEISWVKCAKQYVDPSQLTICNDGIFVNIDYNLIRVNNIEFDTKGVSFSQIDSNSTRSGITYWICPACGYRNSVLSNRCENPAGCPTRGN